MQKSLNALKYVAKKIVTLFALILQSDNEDDVPLSINAWPSTSGSETYVTMEYDCKTHLELHDVTIAIPLPPLSSAPRVSQVNLPSHQNTML